MYVIGTAGHVDHGKSLLVEALTGIDPDRLREEKTRGMTIDLGFAWLTLPSGRSVSIVDVPGHERFIKNMLAGAGGIDLALLVVAADDGVMPQTREHLAILDLLDVRHGVVALTKCDLADDEWLALVENDISDLLAGTTLQASPIVACSTLSGAGLDELRRTLDCAIADLPPKRNIGRPRLPIDRVFTIGGFGSVVTGTVIDGELETGAEIEVMPGGFRGRVRGLQSHREKLERALPGTRTAVNISGIEKSDIRRGLVAGLPGTVLVTNVLDARLQAVRGRARALRHNMSVTFHCFADEANAQVRLLEDDALQPGEQAWAQIKLETPIAMIRGDRFVLRTPDETVAGGIVADAAPKRHRRRDPALFAALETLLSDSPEELVIDAIRRQPLIELRALAGSVGMSEPSLDVTLSQLVESGAVLRMGDDALPRYALRDYVRARATDAERCVRAYHAAFPLRAGMPQEELRSRLALDPRSFAAVSQHLGTVRVGASVAALDGFVAAPNVEQQRQIDAWLIMLRASPASPPADGAIDGALLAYLIEKGKVVDAGNGIVFAGDAFGDMVSRVRLQIEHAGSITLAETRDLFGTTRKYAQALLEHLDRLGITRRSGDERTLR